MPRIRSCPEDFIVDEVPLFPASGEGPHTYLWVEKRLATTDGVARDLARAAGVPVRDVGFAGRKDRAALTRQWYSVPELDPQSALALELPRARVLEAVRHRHKLRLGQLIGNRFQLVVREVDTAEAEQAERRLARLIERGMPNRFGLQRFGRERDNAEQGLAILHAGRLGRDRRHATLLVSALQSEVFNRVLAQRADSYDRILAGDVAVVHASGGLFLVGDPAPEAMRAERFEISPTGPIFGVKMKRPAGEVAALEQTVMNEIGVGDLDAMRLPRGLHLDGTRRALRVRPEVSATVWDEGLLRLEVELPAGSYATVLLEELFPQGLDEGPATAVSDF